jgi:hypothetical protein
LVLFCCIGRNSSERHILDFTGLSGQLRA